MWRINWSLRGEEIIPKGSYNDIMCWNHQYGADVLQHTIQMMKPDFLITLADTRMLYDWFLQIQNRPPWILYLCLDGYVWSEDNKPKWARNWLEFDKQADKLIVMSEYAKRALDSHGVESTVIPHGVETSMFKPYAPEVKENIRKDIEKQGMNLRDKFVVLSIFKNMERKNPSHHLQAFKLFQKDKKGKVALILHTNPSPAMGGGQFDLPLHVEEYGLEINKDVFISPPVVPLQNMPILYNSADAFLMLSGQESFCLPVAEAMACGVPVVATDGWTATELLDDGKSGLLVKTPKYGDGKTPVSFGSYNCIECVLPDIYDAAKQLDKLYYDAKLREELGMRGAEKAVKVWDWNLVIKDWKKVIDSAVGLDSLPAEWQAILNKNT